ncbi:MAG TPA: M14 family metallopeptidase [Anaerolineales bacterium]|nr:M14 family metallopeptidase [Anaerolineales bacterium]
MSDILSLYPKTYEASRLRFRENLPLVQKHWAEAKLSHHKITGDEDLTIDWITSGALETSKKVFILTTAEHGIEGYVGSAVLQRFFDKFLSRLDPQTTGLLLVHTINPWGMKYHRRVNRHNVDLNRTFVWDNSFDKSINPNYDRLLDIIQAYKPIRNFTLSNIEYYLKFTQKTLQMGWSAFKSASLLGQYRHPNGLFYGGEEYQEETKVLIDLYRQTFDTFDQILHLDMHTGYGPRYQMSLVNSVHERRPSQKFVERFNYPLVVAATPQEFYAIQGDMIDFIYEMWQHDFPLKKFYATAFEFGTYGSGIKGKTSMQRAMSFENRLYQHGTDNKKLTQKIKLDFEELFHPAEPMWREKAILDADQAFEGILEAEGYLRE